MDVFVLNWSESFLEIIQKKQDSSQYNTERCNDSIKKNVRKIDLIRPFVY